MSLQILPIIESVVVARASWQKTCPPVPIFGISSVMESAPSADSYPRQTPTDHFPNPSTIGRDWPARFRSGFSRAARLDSGADRGPLVRNCRTARPTPGSLLRLVRTRQLGANRPRWTNRRREHRAAAELPRRRGRGLVHRDPLREIYDECLHWLENFRSTHLEFASRFIQSQAESSGANPTAVGTGGTPFMVYLAKHRDETSRHRLGHG